ncbi:cobyrinic acid ac-diamide synthase, partial [Halorubrum pallidum]
DAPATRAYRDLARALTGAEIPGATGTESESTRTESGSTRTDPTEPEPSPGRGDEGSGTETEREGTEDESSDGVDTLDGVEPSDEAGSDGGEDSASTDTEDIIIADAGSGGLGEPTGERDIIVADESPAPADESDADPGPVESAHDAPERDDRIEGLDTDTRTVGNDRVDADDLESMIEDEAGDAAFDPERESPAGDESTGDEPTGDESTDDESTDDESTDDESTDDEPTGDESAGDEGASDASDRDIDDELAGSVPFRDDDTGTMNTVLSEQSGSGDQQETTDGSDEADDRGEGDEDDGTDGDGFFSRLFGR